MKIKNIFLDRDGTIIHEKHYLSDPKEVELIPEAGPTLAAMQKQGCRLFLITNQSGLGRGYFKLEDYLSVQEKLGRLLYTFQVNFTDTQYCPHRPDENCLCRKPRTLLWDKLRKKFDLDPKESIMIGDKEADILFGRNCGFKSSILVLTGHGLKEAEKLGLPCLTDSWMKLAPQKPNWPDIVAKDIQAAWKAIKDEYRLRR
ncbi:D-glycero-alpha-D-manno-heptose-1,7-bisphosphate 7-phosphatase [Desulfovulcanus sp.]